MIAAGRSYAAGPRGRYPLPRRHDAARAASRAGGQMHLKGYSALRTAIFGSIGFLFANVASLSIILVLSYATRGQLSALLFLIPSIGALWIATEALRETARGLRSR